MLQLIGICSLFAYGMFTLQRPGFGSAFPKPCTNRCLRAGCAWFQYGADCAMSISPW